MSTCDTCQYCYQQSNHYRNARMHTIHFICSYFGMGVNPDDTCELWRERKGKMKIRYKDGYVDEVEE